MFIVYMYMYMYMYMYRLGVIGEKVEGGARELVVS